MLSTYLLETIIMKICTKCKNEKELDDFSNFKNSKDGKNPACRKCKKEYDQVNKEKQSKYHKLKREKELDLFKIKDLKYKRENLHKSREYEKNKWKTDEKYRLKKLLRCRLHSALKVQNSSKYQSTLLLLGCSIEEFKQHLESQFKPEMNWSNHGKIWEMDHIKPCAFFNLLDGEEQKLCFHYTNFQPLFKTTEIAESFGYKNEIGNRNKLNKH